MMTNRNASRGRVARGLIMSSLLVTMAAYLTACDLDSLLDVEDPDVTLSEDLFDPGNLPALRASALGDFAAAYSGTNSTATPGLTHFSGLMADEFWHSGTFGQNREVDRRLPGETNGFVQGMARNMYRARRVAALGFESYSQNQPNTAAHAEMANLHGWVFVHFAENFCSGVPFSEVAADGRFEYGGPLTTAQMLGRANEQFTSAQTIATAARGAATSAAGQAAADAQIYLARIGLARVQQNLNMHTQAAALVQAIPTSWSYQIAHSANTGRQNNGVWGNNHGRREISLASQEGGVGVQFRRGTATATGVNAIVNADPRMPWSVENGAADTRSVHWFQQKYPGQDAPVALASGIQARLIEAEAALNGGQSAAYLTTLNTLRSSVGLGPLSDPGTAAGRIDQFFSERAMWLFGTATRLGDMRRMVRQYNRAQAQVFPSGLYTRPGRLTPDSPTGGYVDRPDGNYGTAVNFPVTIDEQNNPEFVECIDRNP